jgi:Lrp/AsnC family transcriptional regulator
MAKGFDKIDQAILAILQKEADRPVASIAEAVGLTATPCWRRIRRMEESGLIERRIVVLDPVRANLGLTVFIGIKAPGHGIAWLERFKAVVEEIDEIVEAYRLTGQTDYILKVVAPDMATYDSIYKRMISLIDFRDVTSSISMEELKLAHALPTKYIK